MSDDTTNVQKVTVRMHPPDYDALQHVIEEHEEWSNQSDAMRGLVRQAASGTVAPDGGPVNRDTDEHRPTDDLLAAVYDAALTLVGDDHRLDDDLTGAVAKVATNADLTDLSPSEKVVRNALERLQQGGYVCYGSNVTETGEHTTFWRVKPAGAVPEMWRFHPDRVEERREQRRKMRERQQVKPHSDTEQSTTIDAAQWLHEEQQRDSEESP